MPVSRSGTDNAINGAVMPSSVADFWLHSAAKQPSILRKVYGVAGAAHQNAARLSYRFAWPSGEWGSLPLEGGIEAAYKAQLEASDDPAALRAEIEARLGKARDPFKTAEVFLVDDIVDPRETRPRLCEFANLAAPRRVRTGPPPRPRP